MQNAQDLNFYLFIYYLLLFFFFIFGFSFLSLFFFLIELSLDYETIKGGFSVFLEEIGE